MINSIQYFISKFERIPPDEWTYTYKSPLYGALDVFGHCNVDPVTMTEEGEDLIYYLSDGEKDPIRAMFLAIMVNDGDGFAAKYGSTPKRRVLNKLIELREKQDESNIYSNAA